MYGAGFDVGGAQDAAQSLMGMGGAHANSFPTFIPAAQPAADTAAGSAAGEAPGPAGESQGGYATQEGASQGATEAVDSVRLAAARTIVPGCGLAALAGWKPAAAKPRRVEMFAVILERDSSQQPKHWDAKKMFEWLLNHGPRSGQENVNSQTNQPASAADSKPAAPPDSAEAEGETSEVKVRWSASKSARMLHCIAHKKEAFVTRDARMNREEIDGVAKDSLWQEVAMVFNDPRARCCRHVRLASW